MSPAISPDGQENKVDVKQNKTSILRRLLSTTNDSINHAAKSIRNSVMMVSSIRRSAIVKPAKSPTAERIFKVPKLFWKQHFGAEIVLFNHPTLNVYEVVAYNVERNVELNRLYLSATLLHSIIEANLKLPPKQELKRRELIKNARMQCAIDFIITQIDINTKGDIYCSYFNKERNVNADLCEAKPVELIPGVAVFNSPQKNRASTVMTLLEHDKQQATNAIAEAEDMMRDGIDVLSKIATTNGANRSLTHNVNPNTQRRYHYRVLWWRAYTLIKMELRVQRAITDAWRRAVIQPEKVSDLLVSKTTYKKGVHNFRNVIPKDDMRPSKDPDSLLTSMQSLLESVQKRRLARKTKRRP